MKSITEFAILILLTFTGTLLEASIIKCSREQFYRVRVAFYESTKLFFVYHCLFCHFKLYYSPFCDETFKINLPWGKNMSLQRMGNNLHALFMSKFLWVFKKKIKLIPPVVSLILFCFLLCDWVFNIAGVFHPSQTGYVCF